MRLQVPQHLPPPTQLTPPSSTRISPHRSLPLRPKDKRWRPRLGRRCKLQCRKRLQMLLSLAAPLLRLRALKICNTLSAKCDASRQSRDTLQHLTNLRRFITGSYAVSECDWNEQRALDKGRVRT
jgi:hypothetical protein